MKLCGVTTLLDRKEYNEALWYYKTVTWEEKEWGQWSFVVPQHCCMVINEMNTMKLCFATALLHSDRLNEYNEALWCHNIVGWAEKEWGQWSFVVLQHCCMGRNRMRTMKLSDITTLLVGKKYNAALWCLNTVGWKEKEWGQWSFVVSQHCYIGRNRMSTMKICGVTTLLNGKKMNDDNEALWCHSIVLW